MRTSQRGIEGIKYQEGCRLVAYRDQVGVLTIGYGHTGADVTEGLTISQETAERLLVADLVKVERAIVNNVRAPLRQEQFDALASFVFNVGIEAFTSSTMLRKLNALNYEGAAAEFDRWIYGTDRATGEKKVLPVLVRRRAFERSLFSEGLQQAGRSSPAAEQAGASGASPSPAPASATQPDRTDGSPAFLQPEWPFEGTTMPLPAVASIGLAMLPELLSMAPAIVRLFGKSDNSERNAKALEIVGPKLAPIVYGAAKRAVPDAVNEQDVVEKLRADPELQKKFNAELAADYDRLLPLLDKAVDIAIRAQQADDESRDKAAARVKGDPAMAEATPLLIRFALSMLTGVIVLLVALMGVQVWITDDHKPSVELIVLFVSIVSTLLGIAGTIYTYRFGSSSGSKASGDAVRAIAESTRR